MNGPNLEERLDRVETHVRNIDLRLERVEQILPTLATKDDLKGMPTVDDPKGFATKNDLKGMPTVDDPKGFATKEDLKAFATKEDLNAFATKEDLKAFATKEDLRAFATKEELKAALRNHPTRAEVDAMFAREGEVMRTFVLEVVEKSAADTRHEMRVLFEQQQTWFHAMLDAIGSVREDIRQVDAGSRARDAALDERLRRLERQ